MFKATFMFNCTKRFWQLILIYFTWFVHNFVHHKYNVLLKRKDVCLMPCNTFVCVCFTSIHCEDFICLEQLGCQGTDCNDVELKTFLSSAKSLHRYSSTKLNHIILFTHQKQAKPQINQGVSRLPKTGFSTQALM